MNLTRDTPFDDAFNKGKYELSIRSFNILKREGVQTVGGFLGVSSDDLDSFRHCRAREIIEIAAMQAIISEIMERDTRQTLINFLLAEGLAEEQDGYGHASAEQVADKLLERFDIEERE